ncbi:basic amino acid/polyamine antiporter, APA family [Algoriphagus alkaliphilus]|uniref:Basic amino acid/polyamine antiporter, APA family n=1 Tax=Algoriphagus alkaliphilus TaxID=279824 RepID=A0A1G5ZHL7_9BACT|nr:amino acid permease [Algoriphagus alkaliphilus]SDA94254.1 basic amino acid/polyamine antiporter, APA family [Algoriphagus alkaliphilus]
MSYATSKISWKTAAGLVISSMIGTGVFTSLGFQLLEVQNTWSILLLWTLGGVMALVGAFTYAELGTHFRKTGGDYIFLSEAIHPAVGYLYAWVSLTVGFSAPIAIAAMAMNGYLSPILGNTIYPGLFFLLAVPVAHIFSVSRSAHFQDVLTLIKIAFVILLIILGFGYSSSAEVSSFDFSSSWQKEVIMPGFAVSLIYVFYAYTGWNSAAYIIEEVDHPEKNLPKALIWATFSVMVVYLLLQMVFLRHASIAQLIGKVEVADIAFGNLFGTTGALWVSFFIGIQLIATISGYAWIGPRITYAMAKDFKLWKPLAKVNTNGIPVRSILLNTGISLILFLSGSFEQIMLYAGFVLQLMGTITVYSSLRIKKEIGFKSPFKPWLQYSYIIFSSGVMIYLFWDRPMESFAGLGILALGLLIFLFDKKTEQV